MSITADFFRNRLDQMIYLSHPLADLANRMPWQEIEVSLAHLFAHQVRTGKKIEDSDLFGATEVIVGAGVSKAGPSRLPTRFMGSLLYLKHAFDESDEDLIQRWGEKPTCQYFSGNEYLEHRWPCDPTQLVKFRKLLVEEGVEELFARTIEVAVTLKLIASKELSRIIVDSTVQEKAIANPTDSKLLETARVKLVEAGILIQTIGKKLKTAYVDLGYRGVDKSNLGLDIKHRGKFKCLSEDEIKLLKRIQAIEQIIGYLKAGHRMNRCHHKGFKRRQFACCAVHCGFQHPLVAAHDREKGHWPFFAPATSHRLEEHWQSIARAVYRQIAQVRRNAFGAGV
jgi:hypothetical protein